MYGSESSGSVTVAIPVLNGGPLLIEALDAVRAQRWRGELELLVCDSGSTDGSLQAARRAGATVIEIPQAEFSHGGTRNLMMRVASGEHVAFLTQDARPVDEQWLARLMAGFALAPDVGLAFGPYLPRPRASPMVARELTAWFESFAPDGRPRVDRLPDGDESHASLNELMGPLGFFTDANGCVARRAWEEVPFRDVGYAEDRALARDMLRAGWAKAYVPTAGVLHSHDYSLLGWLRRSFDEARSIAEVYGWPEPLSLKRNALLIWGSVGADWRWDRAHRPPGRPPTRDLAVMADSLAHHLARLTGAILGARANRLPPSVARFLSLERRDR